MSYIVGRWREIEARACASYEIHDGMLWLRRPWPTGWAHPTAAGLGSPTNKMPNS